MNIIENDTMLAIVTPSIIGVILVLLVYIKYIIKTIHVEAKETDIKRINIFEVLTYVFTPFFFLSTKLLILFSEYYRNNEPFVYLLLVLNSILFIMYLIRLIVRYKLFIAQLNSITKQKTFGNTVYK